VATTAEPVTFATIEEVPIEVPPNVENRRYLQAKREKLGHRLHHQDLKFEPEDE
jgi:3,4-dihydroxy 2-butanone 4-phosphate synthase/GTP cyclohydrolase II